MDNFLDDDITNEGVDLEDLTDEELVEASKPQDIDISDKGKEPTEESSTETGQNEAKPSHQGDIEEDKGESSESNTSVDEQAPFHKHPRFRELTAENRALKDSLASIEAQLSQMQTPQQQSTETVGTPSDEPIPEWFATLYGEDKDLYNKYREVETKKEAELTAKVLNEINQRVQQEQQFEQQQNAWVNDNLERLRQDGHEFDQNKLLQLMLDYQPTDNKGNFDFDKGIQLYNQLNTLKPDPVKNQVKKKVVSETTKPDRQTTTNGKEFITSQDLRGKSFASLVSED